MARTLLWLRRPGRPAEPSSQAMRCSLTRGAALLRFRPGQRPRGGGGRGGWGRSTARAAAAAPLPLSYTRIGIAVQLPAGWCPSLRTRIAACGHKSLTGIVPATASVPVRHQLMGRRSWQGHLGPHEPGELAGDRGGRLGRGLPAAGSGPGVPGVQPRCAFQDRASVLGVRARPPGAAASPRSRERAGRPRRPRSARCAPAPAGFGDVARGGSARRRSTRRATSPV